MFIEDKGDKAVIVMIVKAAPQEERPCDRFNRKALCRYPLSSLIEGNL